MDYMNCRNNGFSTRHWMWVAALASLTLLLCTASTASAAPMDEMSLEDLLDFELSALAISSIHHTHEKGEWMVGYRYKFMSMKGNRDGTDGISADDVLASGFMATPLSMDMHMHMIHVMYAPTDSLTVMAMLPFVEKSMKHKNMLGKRFTTRSDGVGDLKLSALYSAYNRDSHRIVSRLGLSLPTGSIDEIDDIPILPMMGGGKDFVRLPYPMQIGSGTVDLLPGLTYLGQIEGWGWGADVSGVVRLHKNDRDYRLGNRYEISAWGARKLLPWASGSARLAWTQWGDIAGEDDALDPMMVPTADPELRSGRRLDVLLGLNLFQSSGVLEGHRLTLEVGLPAYQRLDGPQLETDWSISAGWELTY